MILLEVSLDQGSFSVSYSFEYVSFLNAFVQLQGQSVMDGREFLKSESIFLPGWYFLKWYSSGLVRVLQYFFHVIYPFSISDVFSISIFYSKIVLSPLHTVVGLFLYILQWFMGRILFPCFRRFYFVCIDWHYSSIFRISLLSPISFDLFLPVVLSDLTEIAFLRFFNIVFFLCVLSSLIFLSQLLYLSFYSHFPSR